MTVAAAKGLACVCGGEPFAPLFTYASPPPGEPRYAFALGAYRREVWRCQRCGHCRAVHDLDASALYSGDYVNTAYAGDGILRAYDRIMALPPSQSDNAGRVARVVAWAERLPLPPGRARTILDVGSGLCVFLSRMKAAGWACTALDPDARAVTHAREVVGVDAIQGAFLDVSGLGRFDLIAFNKVLEHVQEPAAMLIKAAKHLAPRGGLYVEVPDGEMAARAGAQREEFFIDHWHVFSAASLTLLASRAGYAIQALERLQEPSGKYTLRALLVSISEEAR
ncbi:MAG: class I SAM-dependent methyltransferase [Candidatus Omnitrophica bacterium]|nr:class I SAM-dependent methyltransferase [Candidatus Omnitrophota bacterium]